MRKTRFLSVLVFFLFAIVPYNSGAQAGEMSMKDPNGVVAEEQTVHDDKYPEEVLSDVFAVEAGVFYSFALKQDGTVWA